MTNTRTVMVVEDDLLIRMGAVDIAESAGFRVIEAANADEAIAVLEAREDIQLVFTDVDMPGTMDGLRLAHYVRARWPPVRLIVASGMAIPGGRPLPAGAEFFSKPYHDRAIADALVRLLGD